MKKQLHINANAEYLAAMTALREVLATLHRGQLEGHFAAGDLMLKAQVCSGLSTRMLILCLQKDLGVEVGEQTLRYAYRMAKEFTRKQRGHIIDLALPLTKVWALLHPDNHGMRGVLIQRLVAKTHTLESITTPGRENFLARQRAASKATAGSAGTDRDPDQRGVFLSYVEAPDDAEAKLKNWASRWSRSHRADAESILHALAAVVRSTP